VIGRANGRPISITGLGWHVPERVLTNDELAEWVDTSDEWITTRTGIRERRIAAPEEAMTDLALPAARQALAQAYGMVAAGLSQRALVVGGDVLSKIVNWRDRSTCVLFGDGAGAVVLEFVDQGGFLGFELGADGAGGIHLTLPAGGSRLPASAETIAAEQHFIHQNGREVYKFATRVLVSSAEQVLAACDLTVDDVDVYIPHQANLRIIDHAVRKLGIPPERVVTNVDRYGNTSSGSIPLALADAAADGRLQPGKLVLMTGMGAGLTWGSGVMEWTEEMAA
jgi:3-oxoacyl-[acyl-carrier-protein] synthase-3